MIKFVLNQLKDKKYGMITVRVVIPNINLILRIR